MRWPRTSTGIGCAAAALLFAACATPGYSPTRLQSQLVQAGTTLEQARCVTDGMSAKFDLNQLGSHSDPSAITHPSPTVSSSSTTPPRSRSAATTTTVKPVDEYQLTRDILKRCGVTLPLQAPPP